MPALSFYTVLAGFAHTSRPIDMANARPGASETTDGGVPLPPAPKPPIEEPLPPPIGPDIDTPQPPTQEPGFPPKPVDPPMQPPVML